MGELLRHIGWNDKVVVVGRIDITANEFFIPGLVASWLPGMFYFGPGVTQDAIDFEKSQMAVDNVQLGSIDDALDLIEWWMDEAGDSIDERALLESLEVKDGGDKPGV
ncbi:MAG: hypothetical protein SGARI_006767 [Bacillariaceae sp.]